MANLNSSIVYKPGSGSTKALSPARFGCINVVSKENTTKQVALMATKASKTTS